MKKITLSLLVVLFCTASVFGQKTVLFIGNNSSPAVLSPNYLNAEVRDTLAIKNLRAQGFTVTFLGDDQTKVALTTEGQAAFDASHVLVISSTVGGADVVNITAAAMTAGKPVLTWETAIYDDIKIMSATTGVSPTAASTTVNSTIGAPFIGSLTTFTYSTKSPIENVATSKNKILGAGVVNLATTIAKATDLTPLDLTDALADTTIAVASYLKLGEMGFGTTTVPAAAATASAVAWSMFTNDNLPFITSEGWELFLRAVCVLADKTYVPTTGLKNVSSDVNANVWFTNGNLNIELSKNLTNSKIRVYNTEGKLVSSKLISGSGVISVPVSNLKGGMYMVVGEGFKGKFIK